MVSRLSRPHCISFETSISGFQRSRIKKNKKNSLTVITPAIIKTCWKSINV
jgi:hypothetical protein